MPVHTIQSAAAATSNAAVHLSDLGLWIGPETNADGTDRPLGAADQLTGLDDTSGVPGATRDVTVIGLERGGSISQLAQQASWSAFDVTFRAPATDALYKLLRNAVATTGQRMRYDRLFTDLTGVYGFCFVSGWVPVPGFTMAYTITITPTGLQTPYDAAGTSV